MTDSNPAAQRPTRTAIVCPGAGRERRGYERITMDMYQAFRDVADVTFFKGGGARSDRERVPPSLRRDGPVLRWLPLHRLIGRTPYHMECLTFALSLMPRLARGNFDVVFTYDPPMLKLLWWIRRLIGARFRILFAHGGAFPFEYWPWADMALHCSPISHGQDLERNAPAERIALLPIGIWPERFEVRQTRAQLRAQWDVPASTFVILSIAALNRTQKRIDHLIEEVARLDGELLLWIDGSQNFDADLTLIDLARERLGARCRITHVRSEQVGELLALSDIMVVASLHEGFGLSIVESLCVGTPVLTHDADHFHWLLDAPELNVDMATPGALAAALQPLVHGDTAPPAVDAARFRGKYGWLSVRDDFVALFDQTAALPIHHP